MPLQFDRQKLRASRQTSWLALDLVMVGLVLLNLALIVFDTLYATAAVQATLERSVPAFNRYYGEQVHTNFLFYDLVFVAIFLAEFCFQWVMAVRKQLYARWYFYPFLRWYDLVGCIPIGSLRLLRLLRLVSLLVRLQKMGVIDLTGTRAYRFFAFYFDVFVDEVSDRVILRTLDDVRREVQDEAPITRDLVRGVIAPRRDDIVRLLSRRIGEVADRSYRRHQDAIRGYVSELIDEAVNADAGIRRLERAPVVGRTLANTLRQSINDIVYEIFDRVVRDLSATDNNRVVDEAVTVVIDAVLEEHPELGDIGTQIALEAIELVKDRVRVQHWKESLQRRQVNQAGSAAMPTP